MSTAERRPLPLLVWFGMGVAGAVAGLLPWLVTGARLPLQNLAADPSTTETPFALLPFSQYFLTSIVALLVVGGASAGIAGRSLAAQRPRFGALALVGGVMLVQVVAAVQATAVTVASLEDSARSALYAGLVVGIILVSLSMSLLVLLLIARAQVAGATIALSLAALVSASWIGVALRDVMTVAPYELVQPILFVLRWLPPVLVGCAIAWCGFRTAGRVAAVIVSLAALWIGPAFFTAVSSAAGTRVLAPYPGEMAEYGIRVFVSALTMPELVLPPLLVAVIVGAAGSVLLRRLRRRDPQTPSPAGEPSSGAAVTASGPAAGRE
ncbi:hypothetical protein [Microbacterium sp. RU33B]|uniref:hypothetical protein n=1 Tax=Microbacterium sp. RU33B TaxID=1907390 RepID=UPI0009601A08|nr:hypothetical protein [Microbacterium sp. RU33B]SIT86194.1 hypothetical protein SAMN05880545_2476 [Microbacterium sp. RU33B]